MQGNKEPSVNCKYMQITGIGQKRIGRTSVNIDRPVI